MSIHFFLGALKEISASMLNFNGHFCDQVFQLDMEKQIADVMTNWSEDR